MNYASPKASRYHLRPGQMTISVMGRPQAYVGATEIQLPEKAFCLIAALALAPGYEIDRDFFRHIFWEDASGVRRAGNLRQLLLRITDAIHGYAEDLIKTEGKFLKLNPEACPIDLVTLRQEDASPVDLVPILRASSELLETIGEVGSGYEDWLREQRQYVSLLREQAARRLLKEAAPGLDPDALIDIGTRLIATDPLDEIGHRAVIRGHAGKNDMNEARRAFANCKRLIRLELDGGLQPETQALGRSLGFSLANIEPETRPAIQLAPTDPTGVPRLVILPSVTIFADPVFDRIAHSLLDDVSIGLSRYRTFRVIAAHTGIQLANRSLTLDQFDQLPAELQFDYVIAIGVKGNGNNLIASCRMTRQSTHEILWSIELPLTLSALQASFEGLVRRVVISLADVVERTESHMAIPETDPSAYRLYLEGKRALTSTNLPSLRQARKWFRHSLKRNDSFAPALAGLSRTMTMEWLVRGMNDEDLLNQSHEMARHAQRNDPNSGRGYRELGFVSLYRRRHEESVDFLGEARLLNPHDADLLVDLADALCHNGQPDQAESYLDLAMKLNPLPPDFYYWIQGFTYFRLGLYKKAVEALKPVSQNPENARLLAASYAMSGNLAEARRYAAIVREHYPTFTAQDVWHIVPDRSRADTEQLYAGLVAAGLG